MSKTLINSEGKQPHAAWMDCVVSKRGNSFFKPSNAELL